MQKPHCLLSEEQARGYKFSCVYDAKTETTYLSGVQLGINLRGGGSQLSYIIKMKEEMGFKYQDNN